jgi:serine/threonine protein kinase
MDARTWDKAKDLIADVLELPKSQRDAYLEAHCSSPGLAAEIRDMIKDYTDHSQFLENPPQISGLADLFDTREDDLEPGSQIGPYVVVDRLGRGGMGQVFLGNDRRLRRKVALKRLLPSALGPGDERARVLREARAAAQISHANVAAIHDVIEHDTRVFIVMEYVEGESLAARLRRERLPIDRVISIGRQLAAALGAAHARGVVHRDLKPGNIQLMPDGTVKVLDFGIATALEVASSLAREAPTAATATGAALDVRGVQPGTPEYMSPEQMLGRNVDERSDIFSLGVVLFEMATGRRPYPDSTVVERLAALEHPAPRADTVDPRVPSALADVIATALEADVRQRFQLAADVLAALDAVQRTRETAGAAQASWTLSTHSLPRRALVVALSVTAFALMLIVFGVITTAAFDLSLQRPRRFVTEPLSHYLVLGFQANFGLFVVSVVLAAVYFTVVFLARLFSLWQPVDHLIGRTHAAYAPWSARLGLHDPAVFGQAVSAIGIVALVSILWWHSSVLQAYVAATLVTADRLRPLTPLDGYAQRTLYRWSIDLLLLGIAAGTWRVHRLRRDGSTSRGTLGILGALLTIVILIHVVPYRILYQNKFERVDVSGQRCYLLNELANEAFVFCPQSHPPRSRVIRIEDGMRRSGVSESIFTPPFDLHDSTSR